MPIATLPPGSTVPQNGRLLTQQEREVMEMLCRVLIDAKAKHKRLITWDDDFIDGLDLPTWPRSSMERKVFFAPALEQAMDLTGVHIAQMM
eukprot:1873683-Prymnesium_polylepis.2